LGLNCEWYKTIIYRIILVSPIKAVLIHSSTIGTF
jgi:hypothetical protein